MEIYQLALASFVKKLCDQQGLEGVHYFVKAGQREFVKKTSERLTIDCLRLGVWSNRPWRNWHVDSNSCACLLDAELFWVPDQQDLKNIPFVLLFAVLICISCMVIDCGLPALKNNPQPLQLTHCVTQASRPYLCLISRIQDLLMDSPKNRNQRALACSELHFSLSWDVVINGAAGYSTLGSLKP